VRSKVSLDSSREIAQGCRVSFINYFYLILLIISQNFCTICTTSNQTRLAMVSLGWSDGCWNESKAACPFTHCVPRIGRPSKQSSLVLATSLPGLGLCFAARCTASSCTTASLASNNFCSRILVNFDIYYCYFDR